MVQYKDFHIPIATFFKKNGAAILTVLLALVMVGGALHSSIPSQAADLVCGDGDKEDPEECDDGNLQSGDGCSSTCSIELCGNLSIDLNEQCDDGNLQSNDGCNRYCQIEFCGDRVIQQTRGEQCDDGNGISGDGCTGSCKLEGAHDAASSSAPTKNQEQDPVAIQKPQQLVPPIIVSQAQQANQFLGTEAGEDYKNYLTREQIIELETIINKLSNGRRLTKQEREWAVELYTALQVARSAERTRYTDLLKQFISTPISTDVVRDKDLKKSNLVDVEVTVAIDELKRAVEVIRRGDLQSAVSIDISRLKRQGIDLAKDAPSGYENYLTPGNRPISVFATLKALKEASEKYATKDVPASLILVRTEAQALKLALPLFEQEYGLDPRDVEPLLTAIENVSKEVTKHDTERVVAAINRFLASLERNKAISKADIAIFEINPTHAAAAATRIAETVGLTDQVASIDNIVPFLDGLSASAPVEAKESFERGTVLQQREALLDFIAVDVRIAELRATLRKDGRTDFDERYEQLRTDISHAGDIVDTVTFCDDSVPEAIRCADEYFVDLQDAVRGRTFFTRLIGTLQDYFDIGS